MNGLEKKTCSICGKQVSVLYETRIEDTVLEVCKECSKLGTVIKKIDDSEDKEDAYVFESSDKEENIEVIIDNYGNIIKKKRESLGLKQEELAKLLGIKESLLHKIESNHIEPSMDLAKRIEKKMHIKLIESVKPKKMMSHVDNDKVKTLGELIKEKLKK